MTAQPTDRHPDPALRPAGRPSVILPFIAVTLIWGSTWLVIKDQVSAASVLAVHPSWTIAYRFALAAAAMFALTAWRGEPLRLPRGGIALALFIGVTQFALNFQFVYRAEIHLTSGIVAICYALLMVPNAILGRIFTGQRVTRGFMLGSTIAIAGIAMLMAHEYRAAPPDMNVWLGAALTCAGVLSASVANIAQATDTARRLPFLTVIAWSMLIGAACDIAYAATMHGPPGWDARWDYAGGIAYLAIVGTVVTFPLYFALIRAIGPGRAAYAGVSVPVVAMLLSTLFEGYQWTWLAAAGAIVAMAGLVIAVRLRD